MKTWNWMRTALSVLGLGLVTAAVGCQDSAKMTHPAGPTTTATDTMPSGGSPTTVPSTDGATKSAEGTVTPPPAQPEAGSAIGGGVEVPPAAPTSEAPKAEAEAPKKTEEAKTEEPAKPAEDPKPEEKKPE